MREYRAEGTSVHVYETSTFRGEVDSNPPVHLGASGEPYSTPKDAQRVAQDMQDAYNDGFREARKSFIAALDSGSYTGRPQDDPDDY